MMKNKQRRKTRYVLEIDLIVTICICKLSCFCQVIQITPANLKDNGVLFERKCQESVLNNGKKKLRDTQAISECRTTLLSNSYGLHKNTREKRNCRHSEKQQENQGKSQLLRPMKIFFFLEPQDFPHYIPETNLNVCICMETEENRKT